MTQEEKQLLLKDLCGRLPYGVKVNFRSNIEVLCEVHIYQSSQMVVGERRVLYDADMVKPYLRPMSSMTKEEREYLEKLSNFKATPSVVQDKVDFYLERHLDYRKLIPMGLALEATEDMYKTE